MADCPQHSDYINLVKGVFRVNKLKSPIFLVRVSVPNRLNPMYRPIKYCLQSCADMFILICVVILRSRDLHNTRSKKLAPGLRNAHWTYAQLLIQ